MGGCCGKSSESIDPPKILGTMEYGQLTTLLVKTFRCKANIVHIPDKTYGLYNMSDLNNFLKSDKVSELKYTAEGFDCDDFSAALKGREREWFCKGEYKFGSTFGTIWGDIRKPSEDDTPRNHAVNYFVDEEKIVWLIEPQTDEIFQFTPKSSVTLVSG